MLSWWHNRRDLRSRAEQVLATVMEQARDPVLFASCGVPDTLAGRFEMLALHLAFVLDRLGRLGPDGEKLAQALTEAFIVQMDDTMRAVGIGDLSVPRKVKKTAGALLDRHQSYGPALVAVANGLDAQALWDAALRETLAVAAEQSVIDYAALALEVDRRAKSVAARPDDELLAGRLS
jgi:cytochrome b pre-mRNA-processing protein 3